MKFTNSQLAVISEFLDAVTPQHIVQAVPDAGVKAVIRVENIRMQIEETLAPFRTLQRAAQDEVGKKNVDGKMTNEEVSEFLKGTEWFNAQAEVVELDLLKDKTRLLSDLYDKTAAQYFKRKDVYIEIAKALGLGE